MKVEGFLDVVDGVLTFVPKAAVKPKRPARKTTQYNFRCTPEWKVAADIEAKRRNCSVSVLMELALSALQAQRNV